MCSGSTDQCELTEFFVVMLSVDISQCLLRSKHNIEHDVTNCPFLTKKYSKCDSLADFLSYLEHVMIEAVELLNKFEESKPETCDRKLIFAHLKHFYHIMCLGMYLITYVQIHFLI